MGGRDGWNGVTMFLFYIIYVGFGVSIDCVGSLLFACVLLAMRGWDQRRV